MVQSSADINQLQLHCPWWRWANLHQPARGTCVYKTTITAVSRLMFYITTSRRNAKDGAICRSHSAARFYPSWDAALESGSKQHQHHLANTGYALMSPGSPGTIHLEYLSSRGACSNLVHFNRQEAFRLS